MYLLNHHLFLLSIPSFIYYPLLLFFVDGDEVATCSLRAMERDFMALWFKGIQSTDYFFLSPSSCGQ